MSTTIDQLSTRSSARDLSLRRTVDILCAGISGFVLVPVFLILAAAIWLESGGPILYSQLRLGQNGTPFRIYKFRKFRADCDDRGSPLTMEHDDRLTMIGRILAAVKLDELPQLWNVLRGDMSIVGPRPETLAFADCFVNGFEEILEHRPGLFGPCQVIFRHESKLYPTGAGVQDFYREVIFPAKAKIDLAYYSRRTAVSDIGWVLRAGCAIVVQSVIELARKGRSGESTT